MTSQELKTIVAQLPELDTLPKPDAKGKAETRDKGKLTGPLPTTAAEKIFEPILAGGAAAVEMLIELIPDKDVGELYKARYALHALAMYTTLPGNQKHQPTVQQALLAQLGKNKSKLVQGLIIRTLQYTGDASAVPALAALLSDAELVDPAAQAIVTLKGDAAAQLRTALPKATGRAKLAIIQALGGLGDANALQAISDATRDEDMNVKSTALWALAKSGSPEAINPLIEATGATDSWLRTQAVDGAMRLAETLASRGLKDQASKIYQHLLTTRTAKEEVYVKQAAQRGLKGLK